jgi:hypothetical protein
MSQHKYIKYEINSNKFIGIEYYDYVHDYEYKGKYILPFLIEINNKWYYFLYEEPDCLYPHLLLKDDKFLLLSCLPEIFGNYIQSIDFIT